MIVQVPVKQPRTMWVKSLVRSLNKTQPSVNHAHIIGCNIFVIGQRSHATIAFSIHSNSMKNSFRCYAFPG